MLGQALLVFAMAAKFLFVYTIAAINFALGFAAARWLGRGPRSWPFVFRVSARQNSVCQVLPETGGTGDLLSCASPPAGPASEKGLPDLEKRAATKPVESAAIISGAIEQMIAEMERYETTFEQFGRKLHETNSPLDARELETTASKLDAVAQQALKQLNTTMDRLKSLGAESCQADLRERLLGDLDALWRHLNDSAVQVAILSFEPDALAETRERLAAVTEIMHRACRQTRESLAALM